MRSYVTPGLTDRNWVKGRFSTRHPGLDPGSRFFFPRDMAKEMRGGWVYIMADRYRGATYVGVTADLATRIHQHCTGGGSIHCSKYKLDRLVWAERGDDILACIAQEKRMKRWHRDWKFDLIERANPDWRDLSAMIVE